MTESSISILCQLDAARTELVRGIFLERLLSWPVSLILNCCQQGNALIEPTITLNVAPVRR